MGKTFHIKLEANDLGQLLDGLRCRAESWRNTADLLQGRNVSDGFFVPEECRDADEASNIADHYERIIGVVLQQVNEQGGWR